MVNGCCYHHGGATLKNGRRRARLKPLNPTAADYLLDKIESGWVARIGKRDAFGAVGQTMAKLAPVVLRQVLASFGRGTQYRE
jgi:hypothetical protein